MIYLFIKCILKLRDAQILIFWSYEDIIHEIEFVFWNSKRCMIITFFQRPLMLLTEGLRICIQMFEPVYAGILRSTTCGILLGCKKNQIQRSSLLKSWGESSCRTLITYSEVFDNRTTLRAVMDFLLTTAVSWCSEFCIFYSRTIPRSSTLKT